MVKDAKTPEELVVERISHRTTQLRWRMRQDEDELRRKLMSLENRTKRLRSEFEEHGGVTDVALWRIGQEAKDAQELVTQIRTASQSIAEHEWLLEPVDTPVAEEATS